MHQSDVPTPSLMDLQNPIHTAVAALCPCACPFCCRRSSPSWCRSVKRRFDLEDALGPPASDVDVSARVDVENEVAALRETMASQQQTIQDLSAELDEERNAAATAASEAMSMILRLQREKAEVQMEARQFKRFAEEKMDHDQQELLALEDLLFRRDEAIDSLSAQIQAYRRRLAGFGVDLDPDGGSQEACVPQFDDFSTLEYPPLKCARAQPNEEAEREEDHYDALGEAPNVKEDLVDLEQRICQLEALPGTSSLMEKGVIEESPTPSPGHFGRFSAETDTSGSGEKLQESTKSEDFPASISSRADDGGASDDLSDRVYTIDVDVSKEEEKREMDRGQEVGSADIKNLYMRLQALEADRESMREAIVSMRAEKAQLVLFREIAQQLCKEAASPERKMVRKNSSIVNPSIVAVVKWILTFIIWKKKAPRSKYTFGSSNNNVGLMLLLEKTPLISNWKYVTRTQGRI